MNLKTLSCIAIIKSARYQKGDQRQSKLRKDVHDQREEEKTDCFGRNGRIYTLSLISISIVPSSYSVYIHMIPIGADGSLGRCAAFRDMSDLCNLQISKAFEDLCKMCGMHHLVTRLVRL